MKDGGDKGWQRVSVCCRYHRDSFSKALVCSIVAAALLSRSATLSLSRDVSYSARSNCRCRSRTLVASIEDAASNWVRST